MHKNKNKSKKMKKTRIRVCKKRLLSPPHGIAPRDNAPQMGIAPRPSAPQVGITTSFVSIRPMGRVRVKYTTVGAMSY